MAIWQGFCGGSATARSRNVNAERTVNWFPEVPAGTAKVPTWLVPTPGVRPYVVLDNAPVRALFSQDGRMFAVSGTSFYEVFADHTTALRGSTTLDGRPATISSNGTGGNQLFITSGGNGFLYNLVTNAIALITDPDFPVPVEMGWFSDAYFGALKRGTNQFNISALNDGTAWDALDVFGTSTTSDLTVAQVVSHREIPTIGSRNTAVWQNTGDADVPYQPIGGISVEQGCAAAYSAIALDNTVYFLGQNAHGDCAVLRFTGGYQVERISTPAVEFALRSAAHVDDAIAWAYEDEHHTFYVLYVPTLETTWVYDVSTQVWHERAHWDPVQMRWFPHVGRCHCFAWGKHFVGARNSGAIYEMSADLHTDTLVV